MGAESRPPLLQGADALQTQIQACMLQRQNLEAIFNSVAEGIVAADLELRVSNLNLAAQQITGYALQEAVGRSCLEVLGAGDAVQELARLCRERRPVDGYRVRFRDRSGSERQLLLSIRVLREQEGPERGLVLILRDVTELEALRGQLRGRHRFAGLIGKNHHMQEIYQLVEDLADSDATVLILGESGTGKERVAETIHHRSHRNQGPFVKVNCSALSEGLLESELFGHVKGAFTGAIRDKIGRFEQAGGGTVFLDEIGDLSPAVQVKLLRVLQERQIERVGSGHTIQVDVRVIAATHRDLRTAMREGRFREDLFYRLNVMPVEVPPLRQRRDDIPLLVAHFVERLNVQSGRRIQGLDEEATALVMEYGWPGNVRELENAVEHGFIKCRGEVLTSQCLPAFLRAPQRVLEGAEEVQGSERERVLRVLRQCRWNRSEAAARLGMHRTTLWRKLREWGIEEATVPSR